MFSDNIHRASRSAAALFLPRLLRPDSGRHARTSTLIPRIARSTSGDMKIDGLSMLLLMISWIMIFRRSFTVSPRTSANSLGDIFLGDDLPADRIIDVMIDVRDLIREADDLSLQRRRVS